MVAPRSEIADVIAQYCAQLGQMGIRVERVLLFGSYAHGAEREGSDIDVLIVSSDFSALNTRERLEYLGTAAAEEYAFKRLVEGRLTLSQTAELLDLSVYDVQQKARERGIELGATAEQYRQAFETACQLRPQRKMSTKS